MTITFDDSPRTGVTTAGWLLPEELTLGKAVEERVFDPPADSRGASDWLLRVEQAGRSIVAAKMLEHVRGAVSDDLADLLAGGMAAHSALRAAARESLAVPGSLTDVEVGHAKVDSRQRVDVHLRHVALPAVVVPFELDLVFTVARVFAWVRESRLVALDVKEPGVVGTVYVHGVVVWSRDEAMPWQARVTWAQGIPIVPLEPELAD